MSDNGEWVSMSEAARALGISERQARRYAGRLDAHDRRQAGHEAGHQAGRASVVTVKLEAMRAVREMATNGTASTCGPDVPTDTKPDAETVGAGRQAGQGPDVQRIDEMRSEIQFLRGVVEAQNRDAAEMRATMRALVQAQTLALTAGTSNDGGAAKSQADESDRQVLAGATPDEMQGSDGALDTMATNHTTETKGARISGSKSLTSFQRIAARILGIR